MPLEKLNEIMTRQEVVHENFRNLDKEQGSFLDDKHVALIKLLQNTINEKLGDLAFEYGGVEEERFKSTVRKQDILNTAFFDQLIVEGIITPDKVAPLLEKMRGYYALNLPGISHNLKHDFDIILGKLINTGESFSAEYMTIAVKYILRFIGTNIKFHACKTCARSYFAKRAAIQKVVTDPRRYFLGICGEKEILQNINDCLVRNFPVSLSTMNNSRYYALFAFLDCISQVFQCHIQPEKNVLLVDNANMFKYVTIAADNTIYALPLSVMDMEFEVIIGFGDKPNFAVVSHNL